MRALRSLGGEPGPALRSPTLEDRAAGTRRHARAEAVLSLPPAHIWLISPLHKKSPVRKGRRSNGAFRIEYSPAVSFQLSTPSAAHAGGMRSAVRMASCAPERRFPQLGRKLGTQGIPANCAPFDLL